MLIITSQHSASLQKWQKAGKNGKKLVIWQKVGKTWEKRGKSWGEIGENRKRCQKVVKVAKIWKSVVPLTIILDKGG